MKKVENRTIGKREGWRDTGRTRGAGETLIPPQQQSQWYTSEMDNAHPQLFQHATGYFGREEHACCAVCPESPLGPIKDVMTHVFFGRLVPAFKLKFTHMQTQSITQLPATVDRFESPSNSVFQAFDDWSLWRAVFWLACLLELLVHFFPDNIIVDKWLVFLCYFATLKLSTHRVSAHNILCYLVYYSWCGCILIRTTANRCAFIKLETTETLYATVTLSIINSSQSAPEFIYTIIYLCRVFSAEVCIRFCASFSRRIQSYHITFNNRRLSLRPNQTWRQPESNGFLNIDQILIYFLHQTHCN